MMERLIVVLRQLKKYFSYLHVENKFTNIMQVKRWHKDGSMFHKQKRGYNRSGGKIWPWNRTLTTTCTPNKLLLGDAERRLLCARSVGFSLKITLICPTIRASCVLYLSHNPSACPFSEELCPFSRETGSYFYIQMFPLGKGEWGGEHNMILIIFTYSSC